jgi:hypothetical protein
MTGTCSIGTMRGQVWVRGVMSLASRYPIEQNLLPAHVVMPVLSQSHHPHKFSHLPLYFFSLPVNQ